LLEFIASIINPWVDLIKGRLKKGDCALSMTDSTTLAGWLCKTNFEEQSENADPLEATIRIKIARLHASLFIEADVEEYSQWFEGSKNPIADAISRKFEHSVKDLTQTLRSLFPSQLPKRFEIVTLPNRIVFWMISLLQRLPLKEQ
jgi:hypothetical protein